MAKGRTLAGARGGSEGKDKGTLIDNEGLYIVLEDAGVLVL